VEVKFVWRSFVLGRKSNKIAPDMAKAELKTKETGASVDAFMDGIADVQQRADSRAVAEIMQRLTGEKPKMWGPAIIGFGSTTLKYDSGRELDWMKIGFSPRKGNLTLYGLLSENEKHLAKLGKHTTGKGCLYIKRLEDIDLNILEKMITATLSRRENKK
jgi:hypothetical protein